MRGRSGAIPRRRVPPRFVPSRVPLPGQPSVRRRRRAVRPTVLPVLEERGVTATFAVVPAWVGDDGHLDAVAERGAVGALAGHSAWETVPAERVSFVVDAARERGIEVTTHRALLGA